MDTTVSASVSATPEIQKQTFPKAHYWLLIPFFITLAGFVFSYWSVFTQVPFRFHVHGLTATAWYILLILQPWIYHKRSIKLHRKVGFVGIFLAGGVVFSAVQMVPFNIISGLEVQNRYGFSFFDLGAMIGFGASVIAAMYNSKNIGLHARWMITTAFWALIPAIGRLVYIPMMIVMGENAPFTFMETLYICLILVSIPVISMLILDYKLERKVYLPYLIVAFAVPFLVVMADVMGTTEWWIDWCDNVLARGLMD